MKLDNDLAIKVDNISKCYRIGLKENRHDNFALALVDMLKSPLTNFRRYRSLYKFDDANMNNGIFPEQADLIWSLKNVSFEIKKGEIVGIIGRNGAGKSTLLKILCKITHPTKGIAQIRGRIASLLEVGTGFHQELTGRENVYLNGTILGMTNKEVERKFDEIVDFSGVEKFIDTPVKRYSSGMRVRLGFAVAAHLEPELLIVDEVLAVGDAEFQKKCLRKMEDVGKTGRTVLFVSHNMPAITRLCDRSIMIEGGKIIADGPSDEIVKQYLCSDLGTTAAREWIDAETAPGGEKARLRAVRVRSETGPVTETIDIRKPFRLEMEYDLLESNIVLRPIFQLKNEQGQIIFTSIDQDPNWKTRPRPKGRYTSTVSIPGNLMAEGMVFPSCTLMANHPESVLFREKNSVAFMIVDRQEGDSARGDYTKSIPGVVRPLLKWSTDYHESNGSEQ
jgi:lipopolysaccharide transport system ATP-binding protein